MKRTAPAILAPWIFVHVNAAALAVWSLTGCLPTSANLQSARTIDKGQNRITPYVFQIDEAEPDGRDGREHLATAYGVLLGWGTGDNSELQFRFEHQKFDGEDDGVNFYSLGPKFSNGGEWFAFILPIGVYAATVVPTFSTIQLQPGIILTAPFGRYAELTGASKVIVPLESPEFSWGVVNLGMSLSSDVTRWAVMPEVAYTQNLGLPGEIPILTYGVALAIFTD